MGSKPPQSEKDPCRQGGILDVEVLDEVEPDRRQQDDARELPCDPLAARHAAREEQQRQRGHHHARTAAKRDALRHQALQHLGARLVVGQESSDEVQDRARDQQPREEEPHTPALGTKIVRQRLVPKYLIPSSNACQTPKGSGCQALGCSTPSRSISVK